MTIYESEKKMIENLSNPISGHLCYFQGLINCLNMGYYTPHVCCQGESEK